MPRLTSEHKSKDTPNRPLLIIFSFIVIMLINMKLVHFDRAALDNTWSRFVTRILGDSRLYPLAEVYALYRLILYLRSNVKKWPLIYVLPAAFFSFWMIEGRYFVTKGGVDFFYAEKFFILLSFLASIGYFVIYYLSFVAAEQVILKASSWVTSVLPDVKRNRFFRFVDKHPFLVAVIIMVLATIPLYYISYPAIFMGDTRRQVKQALGLDQLYYMHPVLHTLLIRLSLYLGTTFFASDNAGIFIYVVVQGTIMTLALAFCVRTLVRDVGVRGEAALLLLAVFIIHPRCFQYMAQVTKDGIFCSFLICFLCFAIRIVLEKSSKYDVFFLGLFALLAILFRRDGIYIILPTILLMVFIRGFRFKAFIVVAFILAFMFGWDNVVMPAMNVQPGSSRVMYSLVFQGTARYLCEHPDDVTPEEHDAIDAVLHYDELVEKYHAELSDEVIRTYRETATKEDMKNYFAATLSMFKRHPKSFIRAILHNKYEYFYPSPVYSEFYSLHWSLECIDSANESSGVTHFEMPERQRTLYLNYECLREGFWHQAGLGVFISSFLVMYLSALLLCFALRKRQGKVLILLLVILMQIAVMFAGPANGNYFRYTFPVATMLPVYFMLVCTDYVRRTTPVPAADATTFEVEDIPVLETASTASTGLEDEEPSDDVFYGEDSLSEEPSDEQESETYDESTMLNDPLGSE